MSIVKDISTALEFRLNSMPALPPVSFPNRKYKPVSGVMYLRATNLRAQNETLTQQSLETHTGIYQVDVMGVYGKGRHIAEDMADTIADYFAQERTLNYGVATVYIQSISAGDGVNVDDRYIIPVSIQYSAYHTR